MRHLTLAVLFVVMLAAGPGWAAELAAHRAHYALQLEQGRGEMIAGTGSMDYEVTDACDAWAVRQRLQMQLTARDGTQTETTSDYTTLESKDGHTLRFRLRQTTDGETSAEVAGTASLSAEGGEVKYVQPEASTTALPAGTLFPMAHTAAILAAAQAGKKFIAVPLFDGTGTDGAQNSTVAIAGWGASPASASPALAALPSGRVRIAFFNRADSGQEADYEVGMRYYANGVSEDLSMDFGEFVMAAKLKELKLAKPGC